MYVYMFDSGIIDKNLLGGKGANLAEMTSIGLPVPYGFTISTEACKVFLKNNKYPEGLEEEIKNAIIKLEQKVGKKFGDVKNPLLVSVRSGAPVSMPGMMDTILNLGLNDETVIGLAKQTGDERFAYDCYRRFIQMFGNVVLGIKHEEFENILNNYKRGRNDAELTAEEWKQIIGEYKKLISNYGKSVPHEPKKQLDLAIKAVFNSWNNPRAISYRRINNIPNNLGTAVNVQQMVFGNMGNNSATGVGFTRNPATGKNELYGEYLINAQGEDVVAGIRTPKHIDDMKNELPKCYDELRKISKILEEHYKDMQDFEFTIEKGKLYMLQTRTGKRTPRAAVKIAVDMVKEGLIKKEDAIMRIEPEQLEKLLHKQISEDEKHEAVAKGLAASPGAAVGKVVFSSDKAVELKDKGEKVILVRPETSPDDIEGMHASEGILTSRGGFTSHASVVARGMGKPCVVGCEDIVINEKNNEFHVKNKDVVVKEFDIITIDGSSGKVFIGELELVEPEITGELKEFLDYCDKIKRLKVKANADTADDAKLAREFGAEGIGLARTEHMFLKPERLKIVREMLLVEDREGRKKSLEKILPYQKEDFKALFKIMSGLPVIIRLLDPPLHEFLPHEEDEIKNVAKEMNVDEERIKNVIENLKEFNPMLGFRGCRLGVKYPEINEMQIRAIFLAAIEVKEAGYEPIIQIEVPIVSDVKEVRMIKNIVDKVVRELKVNEKGIVYEIGTMIEVPRAALLADEIAKEVDFMSFGTNDLTQMTCGLSRDDAGKFLPLYVEEGIYTQDPFTSLDIKGVGKLMKMCVENARKVKPNIEIGICGEHGGDPATIKFCHKIGLSDVSCSPYRIPVAKLSAAQAVIEEK